NHFVPRRHSKAGKLWCHGPSLSIANMAEPTTQTYLLKGQLQAVPCSLFPSMRRPVKRPTWRPPAFHAGLAFVSFGVRFLSHPSIRTLGRLCQAGCIRGSALV